MKCRCRKFLFTSAASGWIKSAMTRPMWKKFPADGTLAFQWCSRRQETRLRVPSRQANELPAPPRRNTTPHSLFAESSRTLQAFGRIRICFLDGARNDAHTSRAISGRVAEFRYRRQAHAGRGNDLARRAV